MQRIRVVDSHTAGEPTRVVIDGGPSLKGPTLAQQRADFAARFDDFRACVANEPRGNDTLVGALLVPPAAPACAAGIIFFNNVGVLGMCGHGTIGVVATLAYLSRLGPGRHRFDTAVGVVEALLHDDGRVTVLNVPARRHRAGVEVQVPGLGPVRGDVAWGGNWFFLVDAEQFGPELVPALTLAHVETLGDTAWHIRQALVVAGVTGEAGAEIDHIELFRHGGVPDGLGGRNFVLCPGRAYDRSPCGTGTSAQLACLAAEGALAPGATWIQESVIGSRFEASWLPAPGSLEGSPAEILPSITGRAWITGDATLLRAEDDPFRDGIRA